MKLHQAIQTDTGTFEPGQEAALLRSPAAGALNWSRLRDAGVLTFDSAAEETAFTGVRLELTVDPKLKGAARAAALKKARAAALVEAAAKAADTTALDGGGVVSAGEGVQGLPDQDVPAA